MEKVIFSAGIPGVQIEKRRRNDPYEMNVVHAHTFWELYYLADGECVYFIDGKSYALKKGAFVFIGTNCMHKTLAGQHERVLIELDPSSIATFGMHFALLQEDQSIAIQLPLEGQEQVESFLRCIMDCLREKSEGYIDKARLYLLCLLCYVDDHAHCADSVTQEVTPRHRQADHVIQYIEEHYVQEIRLDDIAQALYVSKYHLSRVFKEITGVTIVEYLTAVRLQHARYLLTTTRLPISVIAGMTGFNSLSHFNRIFLRQVGVAPLKYRKTLSTAQERGKRSPHNTNKQVKPNEKENHGMMNNNLVQKAKAYIDHLTLHSKVNDPALCVREANRFFSWDNEKRGNATGEPYLYAWSYYNGVVMEGLCRLSEVTGDASYRAYAKTYLDAMLDGDKLNEYAGYVTYHGLDCYKTAALVLEFVQVYDESDRYYRVARNLYHDLTVLNGQHAPSELGYNYWHCWTVDSPVRYKVWLDGMYMAQPFIAQFAAATGDTHQLELVAKRFEWVAQNLRDEKTGLYWHAGNSASDLCPFFWLRAIGWYALAQVQIIPLMQGDTRTQMEADFRQFADAMLQVRDEESFLWKNQPLEPLCNENRLESSGSSMMAYAMHKAVCDGWLNDTSYMDAADETLSSLIQHKLTDAGLEDIYLKASASGLNNYEHIHWYMTDEGKGVGPFILAFAEALR